MKKSTYYLSGLLLLLPYTPTIYGIITVTVKNKTPFHYHLRYHNAETLSDYGIQATKKGTLAYADFLTSEGKTNTSELFESWNTDSITGKPYSKELFTLYDERNKLRDINDKGTSPILRVSFVVFLGNSRKSSLTGVTVSFPEPPKLFDPPLSNGTAITFILEATKFRLKQVERTQPTQEQRAEKSLKQFIEGSLRKYVVKNKTESPITVTFVQANPESKSVQVQPNQDQVVQISSPVKEVRAKVADQDIPTLSFENLWDVYATFAVEPDPTDITAIKIRKE